MRGIRAALNPMIARELESRMRSPGAHTALTVYLSIVGGISLLMYIGAALGSAAAGVSSTAQVGAGLFYVVVGMLIVLAGFAAPALTAGAISGERERGTLDLLRATRLTARQIAAAKLASALGYILLLVLATVPLLSLAFLLGGVEPVQAIAALCVVLASALLFTTLGLCLSSCAASTHHAVVLTYAAALAIMAGPPVLALVAFPAASDALQHSTPLGSALLSAAMAGLFSLSPVSAVVATEANYQATGSLLWMAIGPGSSGLPAPFLLLCAAYAAASAALFWLTVRRIDR
jgi:ABC-type transport system involved in multi-copper enzyme maturation permease subunit